MGGAGACTCPYDRGPQRTRHQLLRLALRVRCPPWCYHVRFNGMQDGMKGGGAVSPPSRRAAQATVTVVGGGGQGGGSAGGWCGCGCGSLGRRHQRSHGRRTPHKECSTMLPREPSGGIHGRGGTNQGGAPRGNTQKKKGAGRLQFPSRERIATVKKARSIVVACVCEVPAVARLASKADSGHGFTKPWLLCAGNAPSYTLLQPHACRKAVGWLPLFWDDKQPPAFVGFRPTAQPATRDPSPCCPPPLCVQPC